LATYYLKNHSELLLNLNLKKAQKHVNLFNILNTKYLKMTLKKYLIIMIVMTLLCWFGFIYVIFSINPDITNWIGFSLFYVSLFLALVGTSALIGFVVRFISLKQELVFYLVKEAFRQSFLFSSLIVISLLLLSRGLFTWMNLFFLIASLSILEYFLLSYDK